MEGGRAGRENNHVTLYLLGSEEQCFRWSLKVAWVVELIPWTQEQDTANWRVCWCCTTSVEARIPQRARPLNQQGLMFSYLKRRRRVVWGYIYFNMQSIYIRIYIFGILCLDNFVLELSSWIGEFETRGRCESVSKCALLNHVQASRKMRWVCATLPSALKKHP